MRTQIDVHTSFSFFLNHYINEHGKNGFCKNSLGFGSNLNADRKSFIRISLVSSSFVASNLGPVINEPEKKSCVVLTQNLNVDGRTFSRNSVVPSWFGMSNRGLCNVMHSQHKMSFHGYASSNSGGSPNPEDTSSNTGPHNDIEFKKSVFGILVEPLHFFLYFMLLSKTLSMLYPTAVAPQSLGLLWKCDFLFSIVWFLYRWKTNVVVELLVSKRLQRILDNCFWVGFFVLGLIFLYNPYGYGVSLQVLPQVLPLFCGVAGMALCPRILGHFVEGLFKQGNKNG